MKKNKIKRVAKRIGYLGVLGILVVVYINTNQKMSLYATIAFASALVLVVLINFIVRATLDITYEINYDQANDQNYIIVTPKNKGILPTNHVESIVRCENVVFGTKEAKSFDISIRARSVKNVEPIKIPIDSKYCGRIDLSVEECRVYDWFDFTYLKKKVNTKGVVYVYPDESKTTLAEMDDLLSEGEELTYKHVVGNDVSEVLQIREYAQGDSIKNIHWNLSAKTVDSLYVKELDTPNDNSIMVVFDYAESINQETNNAIIRKVCDVSRILLAENLGHTVYRMDTLKDRVADEQHIASVEDYDVLVKDLLETFADHQQKNVAEYVMDEGLIARYAKIIYVKPKTMVDNSGLEEMEVNLINVE
ncbi:MAG TPA: hypothetical protein DCL29_05060 [Eubacterium sp.]|nr:hypothetical protein [Eubacterium sp.]